MKMVLQLSLIIGLASIATGCASTGGYFVDRGRDAADVFTATVGKGAGVKIQAGLLQTGILATRDVFGLRGGIVDVWMVPPYDKYDISEFDILLYRAGSFYPKEGAAKERNKALSTLGIGPITVPFYIDLFRKSPRTPQFYTQIETVVGLGGTLRLGFNPGELFDFMLGWVNVDIYSDDLEKRNKIEQDN